MPRLCSLGDPSSIACCWNVVQCRRNVVLRETPPSVQETLFDVLERPEGSAIAILVLQTV